MGSRMSTLVWIGLVAAFALLLPMVLGRLFTAWRAQVEADRPPSAPGPVAEPGLPAPPGPADGAPAHEAVLRPVDRAMFALVESAFRMEPKTDLRPKEPYRIDFAKPDDGPPRAMLDLDRDGQFDEVWTYGPQIVREVSPADDGRWTERFRWEGSDWVAAE